MGRDLWDAFFELHHARTYLDNGPCPISFRDIAEWNALTGAELSRDDVKTVRMMDDAFLSVYAEEAKLARQAAERERAGRRPA